MLVTMIGVSIIVGHGISGDTGLGDLVALATADCAGLGAWYGRESPARTCRFPPALGGAITGPAWRFRLQCIIRQRPKRLFGLLINGFGHGTGCSIFALSLAPRYIPAPQVAMFFLLETVLAPIWVWLIFADIPNARRC